VCCGATDGDPCEHLRPHLGGYHCEIYATRLGPHYTVNGSPISCVAIQGIIERCGGYEGCGYVEEIRRRRVERGEPVDDLGLAKLPQVP